MGGRRTPKALGDGIDVTLSDVTVMGNETVAVTSAASVGAGIAVGGRGEGIGASTPAAGVDSTTVGAVAPAPGMAVGTGATVGGTVGVSPGLSAGGGRVEADVGVERSDGVAVDGVGSEVTGVGVGVGSGVAVGEGVGVGVAVGEGVAVAVGEMRTVGEGVGVRVGRRGVKVGVGVGGVAPGKDTITGGCEVSRP